jgi:hypothetical protein
MWWNMTYPWETNATNSIGQHVAENGGIRVARWKVGMKPWVLPVCDLKPNVILVTRYTFAFSVMFHFVSSLLSWYWPSTLTHIVCCYFYWFVSPYEIKVNTVGSGRRYCSGNKFAPHTMEIFTCNFMSLSAFVIKEKFWYSLLDRKKLPNNYIPSIRSPYSMPLYTVTIKSLLLLIFHV